MGSTDNFIFYNVDDDYINYLRKEIEPKVLYNKSDLNKRPYVGFVLEINGYSYLVPLSSQIRKTNDITTVIPNTFTESQKKEPNYEDTYGKYIATIKFNCMIPVSSEVIKKINLDDLTSSKDDIDYKNLLTKEISYCNDNRDKIRKKAFKTYNMFIDNKPYKASLIEACCNFPKLETAITNYLNSKK